MDVSKVQRLLDLYAAAYWNASEARNKYTDKWEVATECLLNLHEALGHALYDKHEVLTNHKYKIII